MRKANVFLLLPVLVSLLPGCGSDARSEEEAATANLPRELPEAAIPAVRTLPAAVATFPLQLRANGVLRARRRALIQAEIGGRLTRVPTEGKYYKRDALLVAIDDRSLQLERDAALARLGEAEFKKNDLPTTARCRPER